ncbi:MAG: hypothetical protein BWZ08_01621 [candidate division BRC1 bacterium ADurb.BinA292]|nr:MAG: hypothetical protein BWZ08_01621 [candidate division BRC1 bacterium ADurb.BinA292]
MMHLLQIKNEVGAVMAEFAYPGEAKGSWITDTPLEWAHGADGNLTSQEKRAAEEAILGDEYTITMVRNGATVFSASLRLDSDSDGMTDDWKSNYRHGQEGIGANPRCPTEAQPNELDRDSERPADDAALADLVNEEAG